MKKLVLFIALVFTSASFAQIELGKKTTKEKQNVEKNAPKKNKTKKPNSLGQGNLQIYLGYGPTYTFRNLSENPGLFSEPLGEKNNELPTWVHGAYLGVRANLHKYVALDINLGYQEDGEQYQFRSSISDSTYFYKNSYRSMGVNIKVLPKFDVGKFTFYIGGGIGPSLFINQGQKVEYNTSLGNSRDEEFKFTENFRAFNLNLIASAGISYKPFEFMSIYFMPEYRYGLFSTYNDTRPYIRKPIALSLHFGISVDF